MNSASEPHPQHYNFVRMFIPGSLEPERRSGFLAGISDAQATERLQESWRKFGAGVLPADHLMPPTGLGVSGFRFEKFLCFLITFPSPQVAGESYFGLVVAGPSDDWSPEARRNVPVRYFILERTSTPAPALLEWRPSGSKEEEWFEPLGPGPSPGHPPDFVETILSRFYGLRKG